ncbi:MAG: SDR family oxidoreductase [Chitinophagaceae bacterium]|nr:SDR family oxidoreductase [Oligoflexus sp.]
MTQKVAFITGANRGLGFETARELGEKGVRVILGSRDKAKGEDAAKKLAAQDIEVLVLEFDVNSIADHKKAYDFIDKTFGRLDILVNNAGVFLDKGLGGNTTLEASQDILRKTFDSNFFNIVALTQTLLPLVRKSEAGRIVNLSSILGSLTLHSDPSSPIYNSKAFAYNASKTALNAFTVHLAHELKDTKIKVNSAHPGWVKTDMGGADAMLELSEGGKTSAHLALLPENGPNGALIHLGQALPW